MKTYSYFPGCSLEKMALSYNQSAMQTTKAVGVELQELEDWNCCGATTYFHVDELLAYTLVGRNLAMAEKAGHDLVAPCSACFKNAYFANAYLKEDLDLANHINYALEADNLKFSGDIQVKHLMEVFADDVGYEELQDKVSHPLQGLRVAPYYGCQIVRPKKDHEDVENPRFFEDLMTAIGADPVDFAYRLRCCGGSLLITSRDAAYQLIFELLQNAQKSGADVIATACPLCQTNLECYQMQINQEFGTDFKIPVLYFTQLIGLSLGLPAKKLGIGSEFVSADRILTYVKEPA
ncbi:MAG TPA: CoB--CoM heterodisulfide reductase iron-sulfur subunit B family protein [Anaerolineales bacterium]|nr:CoB--CoM heterodisulfide reductase iron-sulfur subunit B family protein [Anaerolineales bacterium]